MQRSGKSHKTPHDNMGVTPLNLKSVFRSEEPEKGLLSVCFVSSNRDAALRAGRFFYRAATKTALGYLRAHDVYENRASGTVVAVTMFSNDVEALRRLYRRVERLVE